MNEIKTALEAIPWSYRLLIILGLLFVSVILTSCSLYKKQQKKINVLQNSLTDARSQNELYTQPLATGTATVQWVAESKSNTISSLLLGHLTLEKGQKIFLGMESVGNTESKQIGNDHKSYEASFELDIMGESIGKPISHLAQADIARIYLENLKNMMPLKSKIISGLVIFTFNSSVRIEIPILPQIMNGDEIIITEIGKYFKKGN